MIQPVLGRSADLWGYPGSLLVSGGIQALAIPFLWLSRRQGAPADVATGESHDGADEIPEAGPPVA